VSWRIQLLWLGLLLLGQFGDASTTAFGVTHGRTETNWLMAAALTKGGLPLFGLVKVLVAALMAVAVVLVHRFARVYIGNSAIWLQQLALRGTQLGALTLMLASVNNLAITGLLRLA
jgi:hypothetical protein